ncbi:MAG: HTH-type transcriptional regulator ArgP [Hydrogenophaga sp.]|uniref:HTH-type transcriptional regulator ArgP n=1 Tax=Hydrogenophaga sp. TaxID=1904254 RepID=UPI0040373FCB
MLNREQLETFASVVEHGSFDRAAAVLNVTKGAVSQRIKALEDSLSNVLLVRAKPVVPTSSGETLMRHVKMLRLIEEAVLTDLVPTSCEKKAVPVAIAVNADSLATWFSQALWRILETKRIALELVIDDQDHTMERLIKGEVIGCISTKSDAMPGFVAEPLGHMEYRCYATPQFSARHFPNGLGLQAVLDAPAVLFNRKDSLHDDFLEKVFGFQVARYVKHYLPAPNTLREAILRGAGYGLLPAEQAKGDVETSTLIELTPGQVMKVVLYWHRWEVEPPVFQEMTRVVVNAARATLAQEPSK